jgi:uncharacterized protein YbgA (DUF1722 family)/uncharacterized protein YbbK (DUF523 family)
VILVDTLIGMDILPRPRVVVSKCLGFDACRYNGQTIPDRFLARLSAHAELLLVCPEVEIGLGVPRDTIRIVEEKGRRRLVMPKTGDDLTERMVDFREKYLSRLPAVDGFVLKSRSPSCGITDAKVHAPREDAAPLGRGPGLFAEGVLACFPGIAVEDEGRLTNFRIREHFLTRIHTSAAFREMAAQRDMGELVLFHARRKLLFMALSQTEMRALGRIVANHERRRVAEVLVDYGQGLTRAFARMARVPSQINVLMHALGYFKEGLTAREKAHFLDLLGSYREGQVPLSVLTTLLRSWVVRFDEAYLADQVWFAPYPPDLVEIADSGKSRGE